VKRVVETSRFGWYLRVLEEGDVAAGMDVRLVERPYPDWNAAHVFRLRVDPQLDPAAVAGLARCPELTPALRERVAAQLATWDGR
jgi:MOSC domain-containing protein YiiM